MRALDLYCGGGGASMGLHRAGFEVTGVDHRPQPLYPFRFVLASALTVSLSDYDFIWASPPCQKFTKLRYMRTHGQHHEDLIAETRARLIAAGKPWVIENVEDAPLSGHPGHLIMLCGTMFGLRTADGAAELRRHRVFETSFPIVLRPLCQHGLPLVLTVVGHTPVDNRGRHRGPDSIGVVGEGSPRGGNRTRAITVTGEGSPNTRTRAISVTGSTAQTNVKRNWERQTYTQAQAQEAMGIDWLKMRTGLAQAIPPAYSEFIAREWFKQEAL